MKGHTEPVTALALDGNFLFSGSDSGTVRLWDLHSRAPLSAFTLAAHAGPVCGLLLVPESGWLVSCGGTDHSIHVWDYGTGRKLHSWTHAETFRCLAYLRTTRTLVAGTDEHNLVSLRIRDVADAVRRSQEEAEEAVREAERAARKAAVAAAAGAEVGKGAGARAVAEAMA